MRPPLLFPLFAEVSTLQGIGPRFAKLIAKLAGPRLVDLIWHKPFSVHDWSHEATVASVKEGEPVSMALTMVEHRPSRRPGLPYKVMASDPTGYIDLVFFKSHGDYLKTQLPVGQLRHVRGKAERYDGRLQMTHPDAIMDEKTFDAASKFEPVYPGTEGLPQKTLARAIAQALDKVPQLEEWQDPAWIRQQGWSDWNTAIRQVHAPRSLSDIDPQHPARKRLAFDELLASQLALNLARTRMRDVRGRPMQGDGRLRARALAALHFRLTGSQEKALAEIFADMASGTRMLRMLQGDVGAGKTLVAFFAMLNAIECRAQAALMAPTEVLARQHYASLKPLADAAGVSIALLTGRDRGPARDRTLDDLASGKLDILIGTHALISEGVAYRDLGFVVVDEQHRFGVRQRSRLDAKAAEGRVPHVLHMTATPIPRTLSLTAYGDLDTTALHELPAGRQPVQTRLVEEDEREGAYEFVRGLLREGRQAFVVCPLVSESEKQPGKAAEVEAARLAAGELREFRVGVLHGQMRSEEKAAAMAAFAAGETDVLVATTVIEVGIDVPNATVMIIEGAERFGVSQLHQLRGRVGRGEHQGYCALITKSSTPATRERLLLLTDKEHGRDGFWIAQKDLELRGPGEFLGTRQSGLPGLKVAQLSDTATLLQAREAAEMLFAQDPELSSFPQLSRQVERFWRGQGDVN